MRPAAAPGVEEGYANLGGVSRVPARYGGVAVASVHDDSACCRAAQNALVARQNVSDLVGLHHDKYDLGPAGRLGGRIGGGGARLDELPDRRVHDIVDDYPKARLEDIAGHRTAHLA